MSNFRALIFFLALIFLAVAVRFSGWGHLDYAQVQAWIDGFGAAGPLVYILIFVVATALFLPGLPITLAAGVAFGPMMGTVYASIGSTIGAGVAFLISRYCARDMVVKLLGERWRKIDEGVVLRGWVYVAITRLVPIFPFSLLNYAFGLTKIRFVPYLLTSWLCMFPVTAAYVVFSSSFLDVLKGKVSSTFLLIGLVLLLLLLVSLIPFVYRKWKGALQITSILIGWIMAFFSVGASPR